ncbi:MAG: hypothetical protein M3Q29_02540, partial [Chloroflexota bacterium]|nr:hypothetical protein [Chloroflexota bacterium]
MDIENIISCLYRYRRRYITLMLPLWIRIAVCMRGEELVAIEITCKKCGVTKPAEGNFSRSGQAATGYVSVCWVCRKKDRDPKAFITCGECGKTKRAEGNYHRNTSYTGYT